MNYLVRLTDSIACPADGNAILTLYAKSLSTWEIIDAFKEMYDANVGASLISKVTDRVLEQIPA